VSGQLHDPVDLAPAEEPSVPITSEEPHYVSGTETNRLMQFRETVAVYCENHMKHTNALCGQNAEFL
jgi:hypothetical protein